ncbi:MAG: hypothetical protein RIQ72_62 [Candidatus Parcubacteria bacterium]|jgi:hypothetical protein
MNEYETKTSWGSIFLVSAILAFVGVLVYLGILTETNNRNHDRLLRQESARRAAEEKEFWERGPELVFHLRGPLKSLKSKATDGYRLGRYSYVSQIHEALKKAVDNPGDIAGIEFRVTDKKVVKFSVTETLEIGMDPVFTIRLEEIVSPHPGGMDENGFEGEYLKKGYHRVSVLSVSKGEELTGSVSYPSDPTRSAETKNSDEAEMQIVHYLDLLQRELWHRGVILE